MFSIDYIIVDEYIEDIIEASNLSDFDVIGQIKLCFNNRKISSIDSKVRFLDVSLLQWMNALKQTLCLLKECDRVFFWIPESKGIWLVFQKEDKYLRVSKIKNNNDIKKNGCLSTKNISFDQIEWEEMILAEQFKREVIMRTNSFTKEIERLNYKLISSHYFADLRKIIN